MRFWRATLAGRTKYRAHGRPLRSFDGRTWRVTPPRAGEAQAIEIPRAEFEKCCPLPVVMRRVHYDAIARGDKRIEYRLHRPPFTAASLWPGRRLLITAGRSLRNAVRARVTKFETTQLGDLEASTASALRDLYPALDPHAEIALIHFALEGRQAPALRDRITHVGNSGAATICSVADCDTPARAGGLCAKHYMRQRRQGDPERTGKRGRPRAAVSTRTQARLARIRAYLVSLGIEPNF